MIPNHMESLRVDDKHAEAAKTTEASPQTTYFVETTTMHGVKQVSGAPGILKYIWFLVFLALTGLLIWHFQKQVVKFAKYETKTSMSIKEGLPLEFPAVTVCNLNSAKRSLLENDSFWGVMLAMENINGTNMKILQGKWENLVQSNFTDLYTSSSENQTNLSYDDGQFCSDEDEDGEIEGSNCGEGSSDYLGILTGMNKEGSNGPWEIFRYLLEKSQSDDLSDIINLLSLPPEVIEKAGYMQDEFIVECTFDRKTCSPDAFTKSYDKSYGNCFTFNLGMTNNSLTTRVWGSAYGLRLSLNIQAEQYVGLLSSEYGARVSVQRPRALASPLDGGFNAAPGQLTSVGISKTKIIRQKHPYASECIDKFPAEYAPMVVPNATYSYDGCMQAILNSLFVKCGCMDQSSTIVNKSLNHCSLFNLTLMSCVKEAIDNATVLEKDCKKPCMEIDYDRTVSTSAWPTVPYKNLRVIQNPNARISLFMLGDVIAKALNDENLYGKFQENNVESNIVRLHVYFEDLHYTEIEESPDYPIAQLCADLGGVISLYLGLSIVTMLEVMQYIFLVAMKIKPNSTTEKNGK